MGLTEDEDVLQALEEGVLELLLLFPGQLLGDHAAVTQASPQPAGGAEEAALRRPPRGGAPERCPCRSQMAALGSEVAQGRPLPG